MSTGDPIVTAPREVAVIGAGPAGLAAGAWLARQGFEPVLFEAADDIGGQWNGASPMSGTWPGMRTNTSRILTAFADLDHPLGTAVFPSREEVLQYLHRYAAQAGLPARIRLSTRVRHLGRAKVAAMRPVARACATVSGHCQAETTTCRALPSASTEAPRPRPISGTPSAPVPRMIITGDSRKAASLASIRQVPAGSMRQRLVA